MMELGNGDVLMYVMMLWLVVVDWKMDTRGCRWEC